MSKPRFKGVASITGSCCAAVLCTTLTDHLSSKRYEILSDTLCWMILPVLFIVEKRWSAGTVSITTILSNTHGSRPTSSRSLWLVAMGIATASCYKSEIGVIGILPALTPILLLAEKIFVSDPQDSQDLRNSDQLYFAFFANTTWGTTLVALFAIFTLSGWDLPAFAWSAILVAALLVVYSSFRPRTDEQPSSLRHINVGESIFALSSRVVGILIVILSWQTFFFGLPGSNVTLTILSSLAKASSWYFMIQTTRYTSWRIATAIAIFSVMANVDPFMQPSEARAFSSVVASLLALSQIISMLPKHAKGRWYLWTLALLPIIPYLENILAISEAQSSSPLKLGYSPVAALTQKAQINFKHQIEIQSQNYTAACGQYRRRYGMEPPPGFEAWYEFAETNKSPIIDDFDMIYDMVSPFWKLSGKEVANIMSNVQNGPAVDLWHCSLSSKTTTTLCRHPSRDFDRHIELLFNTLLVNISATLPDVDFLVNHLDEPRVLTPPTSSQGDDSDKRGVFKMTDLSRRSTSLALTKFCSSRRKSRGAQEVDTLGLPFVRDHSSAIDLCDHPEYSTMHGLLMSPTSFKLIEGMVPILSTGALSTMGDLLFPSPAYMESEFRYDEEHDTEWTEKENKLYWAGSNTGGYTLDKSWHNFHRQRFVKLVQNHGRQKYRYLREKHGVISTKKSSFFNGRLVDVSFTRIFQCERKYCRDQRAYFGSKSWVDKDRALRSRLVFDIDGNGISGRFYKLLASNSAPLKQTLFREWHDERLIPWVHYVPVSQSMEELPELIFYLTSTEAGQRTAKEIATQGRNWFAKAFRDVDLSIYTYRLLLEIARIQDPKRRGS